MSVVHERSCHCQKENAWPKHTSPKKLFRRIAQNIEPIKTLFSSYTKKKKRGKIGKKKHISYCLSGWIYNGYGHGLFRYLDCSRYRRTIRHELFLNITNQKGPGQGDASPSISWKDRSLPHSTYTTRLSTYQSPWIPTLP